MKQAWLIKSRGKYVNTKKDDYTPNINEAALFATRSEAISEMDNCADHPEHVVEARLTIEEVE